MEGNRFFELHMGAGQRPKRIVEFVAGNNAADAASCLPQLPVQWSAWLSHSRMKPPTIEELQKEKSRLDTLAINVARLEQEDKVEREREQQARLGMAQHPEAPPSRPIGPTAEPQPWLPQPAQRR